MALFDYQKQTQRLLRDVAQKDANPADLIGYINEGRVQLAGESKSIRVIGTLAVSATNPGPYPFTSIALTGAVGVGGVLSAQAAWYLVGDGRLWIRPRPWPWYSLYEFSSAAPDQSPPHVWTQYGQGENGTIYLNQPDVDYTVLVDTVCFPIPLVSDTTAEAIPAPWTTAIPYYATYLALLAAQTSEGDARADKMLERYALFVERGRRFSTPEVLPSIYSQVPNQTRDNQLGTGGQR